MVELSTRRGRFEGGSAIVKKVWSGLGVAPFGVGVLLRLGADGNSLAQISRARAMVIGLKSKKANTHRDRNVEGIKLSQWVLA